MDKKIKDALEKLQNIARLIDEMEPQIDRLAESLRKEEKSKQRDIPIVDIVVSDRNTMSIDRKDAGVLFNIKHPNGTERYHANEWIGENAIKKETW